MIRSKAKADYVQVSFADLKTGTPLPFPLHLYFSGNDHVIVWINSGEPLTADFIKKYGARGLDKIWIHQDDKSLYDEFMGDAATSPASESPATPTEAKEQLAEPDNHARTPEGAMIAGVLNSPNLSDEEKKTIAAEASKEIIEEAAAAKTMDEQSAANKKAREIVKDVVNSIGGESQELANEIWKLSEAEADFQHANNVATYSVIFAMAFGRISPDLLADLALAGLLHDVGMSQVPADYASTPWKKLEGQAASEYTKHVDDGIALVKELAPSTNERVFDLIIQHHEKFDGTGFPKQLKGFKFDDIAQLLAMADLTDAISSGSFDGNERTMRDGFHMLEEMEKARSFPELFNPEVFSQVIRWVKSDEAEAALSLAADVVKDQVDQAIKEDAA